LTSAGPVQSQIFKKALDQNLTDLSIEDLQEHGRLLLLKERLVSLVDASNKLDIKTLAMF
jgi:anti-sigma regulatory factor (Ser/Thr protein kinase)